VESAPTSRNSVFLAGADGFPPNNPRTPPLIIRVNAAIGEPVMGTFEMLVVRNVGKAFDGTIGIISIGCLIVRIAGVGVVQQKPIRAFVSRLRHS
jgi:hypothetical protein